MEPTVDVKAETAADFLGKVNDHLAKALGNFFAGRRPLPSANGDAGSSKSVEVGSGLSTGFTAVKLSLQQAFCQLT